ncbi:MAG: CotH kinase family protein [Bacteroidia bacterium]
MIVKDQSKRIVSSSRLFWGLGVIILVLAIFALGKIWNKASEKGALETNSDLLTITCNADTAVTEGDYHLYKMGQYRFGAGLQQDSLHARSGRYSCKADDKHPYALGFDLGPYVSGGDRIEVGVWRYRMEGVAAQNAGRLIVSLDDWDKRYAQVMPEKAAENGWEYVRIRFVIPSDFDGNEVKTYIYNPGAACWFDDMVIKKLAYEEPAFVKYARDTTFNFVDLRVSEKGMRKLTGKRDEALKKLLLETEDDDWVKGKIGRKDEEIKVKMRLKGDLMDHLRGDKWSFRIKVKAPQNWNRLMTFSLQNPGARNFISEWVYHQFLIKEDILCPRYDFVRLFFNGKNLGPYAYEEHFDKQLLEFRGRREGPIVKFTEEGMWKARMRNTHNALGPKVTETKLNQYETSEVAAFRQNQSLKNPTLANQVELAHSLMEAYRFGTKTVDEVFDLDRLARYFAITDIFQAYHGLFWHNQRFYYNPVIGKLEPIGYDGYVYGSSFNWIERPFMLFQQAKPTGDPEVDLLTRLFLDEAFVERYIAYLWQYTSGDEVDNFFINMEEPIEQRESLLSEEYPKYRFDKNEFLISANRIKGLMFPMQNALRCHQERGDLLQVANGHALPLQVIGYGDIKAKMKITLDSAVWLKPYSPNLPMDFQVIPTTDKPRVIFYRVPGLDSVFVSNVSPVPAASPITPPQALFENIQLSSNDVYQVAGKKVHFPAGRYQVATDIIIPQGYEVSFAAGVSLDMIKGASFISRSAVVMQGDPEARIKIFSSDKSAKGFTVLQAKEASSLSYVSFDGFNTLIKDKWSLTGAVTFFESEITIHQCSFTGNICEDALNLIRCDFTMDNSLIANTFADGFDADFCKGKVQNCVFRKTGNDGMDFSGSLIDIIDCSVISPGDKGISVGEEATVKIISATIQDAVLGVASKDLSRLMIESIHLIDCETGFSAYQKKPEYGPAYIEVKSHKVDNLKRLHLIEKGSVLRLEGQEVETI